MAPARNPYRSFVKGAVKLLDKGRRCPLGGLPFPRRPKPGPDAKRVVIFSPHPDDECIVGALPLRLQREAGARVINVAVTQGSKKERRAARLEELRNACRYLGFDLLQTREDGLEGINPKGRAGDPAGWAASVDRIAGLLGEVRPDVVLIPHDADWNSTHIGTHLLVVDALARAGAALCPYVVETEFWAPIARPNLMVEVTEGDLADLLAALSFHVGEVQRNPYHLGLPSWMIDNVRRGGELVGGQGGAAPNWAFATLYRLRKWDGAGLADCLEGGKQVGAGEWADRLFSGQADPKV